ncbi:MAG: hypothetical protein RBU24_00845, partial [Kiritimatiellia bacterium]|nr:hypothetical protein [Kiritimatiellia bacterium]
MLDASFIEKIVSLAEVRGVEVGGRNYTTAKIYPNLEPEATPLKMHTLSGLVDFCLDFAAQVGERAQATIVHVVSDQQVDVVSPLFGPFKQREKFATSSPFQLSHKFDRYMPVEEFVIYLQSMFVQDDTARQILK